MALDFPANPAVGDEYQGFKWDGNSWVPIAAASGGGVPEAPIDTKTYGRKDAAWAEIAAATGAFVPLDGSGTMTGSLKLASGMGVNYLNAGGAGNQWVEMVSAATFDFLGSTAPFVYSINAATNAITFSGILTVSAGHPTFNLRAATSQGFPAIQIYGDTGLQPYWSETYNDTAYDGDAHFGRSPGNPPAMGSLVDWLTVSRATGVADFASTPTRSGTPLVLKTEHDAALGLIAKLEARLTALEAKSKGSK